MSISPVTASAAASTAQANATVALAQAKSANQESLVGASADNGSDSANPIAQVPSVKPTVNTNGQTIGTTVNVTA
jgi:proline racemase